MARVMKGVRIPEVAQFVFVPAAGAILADRVTTLDMPGRLIQTYPQTRRGTR